MRIRKLSALLVIATWIIVTIPGCNNSNKAKNINETQEMQTTIESTQTTTESTQTTTTQISSEQVLEEISSQISQEVNVNPDSNNAANNNSEVPNIQTEAEVNLDFVANLKISNSVNQMIVVAASGSKATVTMHEIQNNEWTEIISTQGYVGKDGVGNAANVNESTHITPTGIYTLSMAFGVKDNPGTTLPYTKVDDSNYWVDDPASKYYNKFVSTNDPKVVPDWLSAEHILNYSKQYAYVIAIDYNMDCIRNAGSAIFLHCSNDNGTYGCVSIPETSMELVLQHIHSGCVIVIDTADGIYSY
ncbi:L,D-transpeptidase family protein [[Clostridium] fimetarium]|uniref:L,D-peptidoglycan transpeptidase YkuD, ErfK/YbiS/YcfS/YnhG family n=1 Tax=[Clostridium] fimetarium TaxID=99656 RepID=A0A1I0RW31_9FIRM|nr:hypothetical protein [[Clostridium] fimetarium]SEW45762.1 L,D-peptidoglycan transpeptidase YkuD, ErfK/YbiS/YcfS/YnhG family [[Clostridium] fimetarium]